MKPILKSLGLACFVALFSLPLSAQRPQTQVVFADGESTTITFPMDAMKVIDAKCYGCHSPNSRNEKAREKLIWKDIQNMDGLDVVSKMEEIAEVLEEGSMPPEKMLEKYPHMKLTEDEVSVLKAFVESTQKKLMDE